MKKIILLIICFSLLSTSAFADKANNWIMLRGAWTNYVNYPSSDNAKNVSRLLPAKPHSRVDKETLDYIYDRDGNYRILERQIISSDPAAVELAFRLYTIADGAFAEELDIFLGELVRINPKLFLKKLKEHRNIVGGGFDGLLGNFGYVYVDKLKAHALETSLRIEALRSVNDKSLLSVRDECIQELNRQLIEQKRDLPVIKNNGKEN
ncbi:MAG: hypothetical protein WA666_01225 [Nitrospirota bacterium]